MNTCTWIVCERGGRWTPALRLAFARHRGAATTRQRLREVRHLPELTATVAEQPHAIAAIETHRGNLVDVLTWCADTVQCLPNVPCVALLDRSLATRTVIDAVREAGALDVATSPRQLQHLIEFGQRHALAIGDLADGIGDTISLTARAWASLPWQDA